MSFRVRYGKKKKKVRRIRKEVTNNKDPASPSVPQN